MLIKLSRCGLVGSFFIQSLPLVPVWSSVKAKLSSNVHFWNEDMLKLHIVLKVLNKVFAIQWYSCLLQFVKRFLS